MGALSLRYTAFAGMALAALAGCATKEPAPGYKPMVPAVVASPTPPRATPDQAEIRTASLIPSLSRSSSMRASLPTKPQQPQQPQMTPMTPSGTTPSVELMDFAQLTGWQSGDHAPALAAFISSCDNIGSDSDDSSIGGMAFQGLPLFGTPDDWYALCDAAAVTPPQQAKAFFERAFVPVSVKKAGRDEALFTAYYEPELNGSRTRGGPYQTPIYAKPTDLASRDPYFSRADIAAGALNGRSLELFWIDDPVEAFFLEIQGSGRIRLPDGSVTRVGFAGKNGHPYRSIGKTLIEWSHMELSGVSVKTIKEWVAANPHYMQALFNTNPSTVFFTERTELARNPALGPIGSLGLPIFAQRSVAIDKSFYPLGAPMWVEFDSPLGRINHLTIAMDTGGAIKGAGRADYFFGSGDEAGTLAGSTRSEGRLIAFAPRSAIARLLRSGS